LWRFWAISRRRTMTTGRTIKSPMPIPVARAARSLIVSRFRTPSEFFAAWPGQASDSKGRRTAEQAAAGDVGHCESNSSGAGRSAPACLASSLLSSSTIASAEPLGQFVRSWMPTARRVSAPLSRIRHTIGSNPESPISNFSICCQGSSRVEKTFRTRIPASKTSTPERTKRKPIAPDRTLPGSWTIAPSAIAFAITIQTAPNISVLRPL